MMKKRMIFGLLTGLLLIAPALHAEQLFTQSFADTPLEMLVDFYNEWTGRTLIIQADLKKKITLKFSKLTKDEAMQAIETVLSMNGVALVPMGEKFLKVVPIATARQEGLAIEPFDPDTEYVAADQLMTQVIPLRYVVYTDVQELVAHLIHGYGKVIKMDRINSLLITDTSANIAKIVEVIAMIDQPLEKIEPRIYQFKYAAADTVAGKLKELIEAAKTEKSSQTTIAAPRTVPGVIRAPRTSSSSSGGDSFADDTQMIQGEVKLVSDERTNILIIFSKAANFDFFDNIIKVLDVPVDPDVVVETINLEYAEAADIAGILNEFVGAAKETEETKGTKTEGEAGTSRSVADVIRARTAPTREVSAAAQSAIGRLSADTKILSDERTNSLLLMGRKSDIEALKAVIASLDIMLQQVQIEAVILSVGLNDSIDTGIQWVYDTAGGDLLTELEYHSDTNEVISIVTNLLSKTHQLAGGVQNKETGKISSSLNYYGIFPSIDITALIYAAKTDGDARVLSTPVVMTTDNTEAKITIADEYPVVTSSTSASSGYSARSTYEYKTIGIDLTVTPHINPNNFVLMEITQSADDVGTPVSIDGNNVPVIKKREISATVGVKDRETIILGGLVRKSNSETATKIPILGDIPLLGWLFSSRSESEVRDELVILLTPYVLNTPEEATSEAQRRLEASDAKNTQWPRGWSQSPLANDEPAEDAKPERKGFLGSIFSSDEEPEATNDVTTVIEEI